MPEIAPKDVAETEKGFGTGLRAQLERRRETAAGKGGLKAVNPDASGSVPAAPAIDISDADLDALRDELAASLAREEQLRGALSEQVAAHERELSPQQDLAARQAELDERAGRLSAFEAALEERERHLTEQVEALELERRRLVEESNELAAVQAPTVAREQHGKAKLPELTSADDERARAAQDLAKQANAIAAREKKVERAEAALESKTRETTARAEARDRGLAERDETLKARERDLRDREKALAQGEREFAKTRASVDTRGELLGERERELKARA